MSLSSKEIDRYKRHFLLPEIGGQGQQKLKAARVLVVGAGGLGCPILLYLAAAGVGQIQIVDPDIVDLSNLQRQILYREADIGRPKAEVAAEALLALNSDILVTAHTAHFDNENADILLEGCDLVIEGVDRYSPRYALNAACHRAKIPLISVAIGKFDGQIALFPMTEGSACYRCFVPEIPDDEALCETEGVLGAIPGVMGSLAALEAMKYLTQMRGTLNSELLIYQGKESTLRRVLVRQDPACPVCVRNESPV